MFEMFKHCVQILAWAPPDLVSLQQKNLRSLFGAENLQQEKSWEAERLVRVDDMPYIARGESAQITDSPGSRAKDAFWTPTSWHTCIHFWVHGISSRYHTSERKKVWRENSNISKLFKLKQSNISWQFGLKKFIKYKFWNDYELPYKVHTYTNAKIVCNSS